MVSPDDIRIRLTEKALTKLEKLIQQIPIQKRKEFISEIRGLQKYVQVIKYSYMPASELLAMDEFQKLVNKAKELRTTIQGLEKSFSWLQTDYWLEYLEHLPIFMDRGDEVKPFEGIRYFSGEIKIREKLDENLWVCGVDCGFRLNVVTNTEEFSPGKKVVISHLPPKMFGKTVSEGMFIDASFIKKGELNQEEIRSMENKLGEVSALILNLISDK